MAAALLGRGTGLRCMNRELCRVVWRPQTALFSSKPPDRKQPLRRTHIKKAQKQPALDVAKLLGELFHQPGLDTAPPAARTTKPPTTFSSMNVSSSNDPPLSKTEPAASVPPAASSFKHINARSFSSATVPTTSGSTPASLASGAAAVEVLIETTIESPMEHTLSHQVEHTLSHPMEHTLSHQVEHTLSHPMEHTLSHPVEPSVEAPAEEVQTKSLDVSYSAKVEPLIETTIESLVEVSHFTVGTLETRAAAAEGPVEPPIDVATQKVTDLGPVNLSHAAEEEPLIETTIEPAVEAGASPVSEGTIETAIETESGDNLSHSASIQNAEESAPLTLKNEPTKESTMESVNAVAEEVANRSEEMTLESITLHVDQVLVASFEADKLLRKITVLDEQAEKQVRKLLVQTEIGAKSEDERESLTEVLSKWDSLSEDLQELEGESVKLLCLTPPKTPADPPVGSAGERTEETATGTEAVILESRTLAEVEAEVGGLETRNALEDEADAPAKEEKLEVATAIDDEALFEETAEAELLTLDSISEAAVVVLEAMSLESVTLAEVEASLGTLEKESLSETMTLLDKAAEIVAGEQKTEVEDVVPPEEAPEALFLAEDLQMDALMEEQLFSIPTPVSAATGDRIGREAVRANTSAATVAAGSVDVDAAPDVTDDLKEEVLEEEEEEEEEGPPTEASGKEDGPEAHANLDPVQRLFLEKIKEYNNMRRLNGGPLEAEPDYEKYLSEETAKLRRLYGGGDLSSFPRFTFTEPQLDQDSK